MEFTPGMILEGNVKSIADFGAFIALPEGKTGLVHISEVAPTYVSDIRQHLSEGQAVSVKLLGIDERGRMKLSIKQAARTPVPDAPRPRPEPSSRVRLPERRSAEPESFEEKLKHFMADSNQKISGVRQYEHRTRSRKR